MISNRIDSLKMSKAITEFGFTAVVRDPEKLLPRYQKDSPYIPLSGIELPATQVVKVVEEYVRKELSPETYNHSVRVYYYGKQ